MRNMRFMVTLDTLFGDLDPWVVNQPSGQGVLLQFFRSLARNQRPNLRVPAGKFS